MRWALIAHPGQFIKGHLVQTPMLIAEAAIPIAVAQEWIVLATESDVVEPVVDMTLLSNPRRVPDPEDGA